MAHPIPCPLCGAAVLAPELHRQWHADQQAPAGEPAADGDTLTVGDVIAGWLDELDPAAVEVLVMSDEPAMSDSPVVGTMRALQKLARAE